MCWVSFCFQCKGRGGAHYDPKTFSKRLGLEDRLETEGRGAFSHESLSLPKSFKPLKREKVPQGLKKQLERVDLNKVLTYWLYALGQEEKALQELGYRHSTESFYSYQTVQSIVFKGHKSLELLKSPYAISYEDLFKLIQPTQGIKKGGETQGVPKPLKEITLLTLHNLFFRHKHQDWTETFDFMGETFPEYAPYFAKQAPIMQDQHLVRQALERNRNASVLTFMRSGGLRALDPMIVHHLVSVSGQKLEESKAIGWLQAFKEMDVSLDQEDDTRSNPLDIALQQQKHRLVKEFIYLGEGAKVKPHLIIDYLDMLRGRTERGSPKQPRRILSKKKSVKKKAVESAEAAMVQADAPNQREFEELLDILEFRNHQLRWTLMLESLLPINTGQEGLVIRTTDQERVLHPELVAHLWKGGNPKNPRTFQSFTVTDDRDQTQYGRRTVGRITDGRYTLYVKQYPELPGIEEAVGFFTRQILGYGAPNTLLANIHGTAYLFSEGIVGKPLHDYLTGRTEIPWPQVQERLDPEAISGMILIAMLTNPEDGKPDNYMVQETPDQTFRLIGIDNDHSFVPTASKVKGKVKMNVKSILFALDEMRQPLHQDLKRQFLTHRPGDIIREWVGRLTEQAVKYNEIFEQKEIVTHFDKYQSFLGIALHPGIVEDLYKNLSSLQTLIGEETREGLPHLDILRNFHQRVYIRYNQGFDSLPEATPLERFKHVDGREYGIHKKKGFQTLSTGKNLLSTNTMITTKKDLVDYVKRSRGQEIGLTQALQTLEEVEARDTGMLAQQAMTAAGTTIPLDQMTDAQREDFFERLDWSALPIKNQQALIAQMAEESHGDPKTNKSPWRGKLTFKNCSGFTEGGLFTQGNLKKINWQDVRQVNIIIDEKGGENALESLKTVKKQLPEGVELRINLKGLSITDEELDDIIRIEVREIQRVRLEGCSHIEDPELRQKVPGLIWGNWKEVEKLKQKTLREFALNGSDQKKLNLSYYQIGDEGAKALASVLKESAVQHLDLGYNLKIGDEGAKALAQGLKESSVKELFLEVNQIRDEGAKALASVLKESAVQYLYLYGNKIGDEGAKALAQGLKESAVQTLDLRSNKIGDELMQEIGQIVKENTRRLKALGLGIKEERSEESDDQREEGGTEPRGVEKGPAPLHSYDPQGVSELLSQAGLTGDGEAQTFDSPLEQARYYLEQGDSDLYPTILRLLEHSRQLGQSREKSTTLTLEELGGETEFGFGEEGSADGPEVSRKESQEEALDLLQGLSNQYPKALLTLGSDYVQRGETSAALQTYDRALREQMPGTLEQLTHAFEGDGHPSYAELMAENYLEGYMSPVNLKEGEQWLRRALERDTTNPDLQTKLAQVLMDQGGLEKTESHQEIMSLLEQAKERGSVNAASLLLMIEEEQASRAVKEVGASKEAQKYTARQQRMLRALHQAQFKQGGGSSNALDLKELTPDQQEHLQLLTKKQAEEVEELTDQLSQAEEDLSQALPMDRVALETEVFTLKQRLKDQQESHHAALKRILFPEGIQTSPMLKVFYESFRNSMRQQFSLLDAIEGGLASREERFMETQWKEAIGKAVGYAGNMLVSSIPVPANGILAMIVEKGLEMGIEKITEVLQDQVTQDYDRKAEKERQQVTSAIGGFDQSAFVAKGLASIYTYRLQNILPYLTETSTKTLSSKLSLSVIQYLQDTRRMTNPENLTQLATLSFYHKKGATIGDLLQKAMKQHGLKRNDGKTYLPYRELFKTPTIETTDGAQYQLGREGSFSENIQIAPLIERAILQSELLQGKQVTVTEVQMPQLSPMQVSIIEEQDDADYIRRAVQFVSEMV